MELDGACRRGAQAAYAVTVAVWESRGLARARAALVALVVCDHLGALGKEATSPTFAGWAPTLWTGEM